MHWSRPSSERCTTLDPAAPNLDRASAAPDDRLLPPKEHLDPRARTMWYVSESIQCAIWVVIVASVAGVLLRFTDITSWWVLLAASVIIVFSIVQTAVSPAWKYRYWRYEIREDEVDLQHGFVVKTRQLVPMTRIQHVDTRRSPLQQRFGLSSVVFFTAAGSMEIPALSQEIAADVRNRIAELAKVHDDL
ncbi:MAG: PH domain-containing protein [Chloroflexia bacterium]|jgi:membrane protein YdbS with pleckstrin-like domain|nr:PH domain-containing protein [Chloroflexia bacterium]